MATGDLFKGTLEFFFGPQRFTLDLHYVWVSGDVDAAALAATADDIGGSLLAAFREILSEDVGVASFTLRAMQGNVRMPFRSLFLTNNNGLRTGPILPLETALVIKLQTTAPSGRHNGRVFISGVLFDDVTNGFFTGTVMTEAQNIAEYLETQVGPSTPGSLILNPCVLMRVASGIPVIPPIPYRIINAAEQNIPHLQKRRRRKSVAE